MKRYAFFISDGTGITAETLGNSLLAQFERLEFERITMPYVDDEEKAHAAVAKMNQAAQDSGQPVILFDTIVNKSIRAIVDSADAFKVDIFATFLAPLEQELGTESSYSVGKSHLATDSHDYQARIDAINFALDNDDGARTRQYAEADIILVGVSRCGKTPTSLYMAMQFGIKAANYPLTEEDMLDLKLPKSLSEHRDKLYGLSIDPDRLALIRSERRANSRYASLKQCYLEVEEVELLYQREQIPYISTTARSIEEIATRILADTGLQRRLKT
ncbi:phosphoenolpyruvate synthase regulatory protein [Bacterioplanes sanyensis]|uniref:Putative phosphoenolpyruvate synthase regulatory protein n=1 Tax=Bacterioplanes sanyensis TaxID=1249553 RepID=A0A222FNV1_9GAMM|nr:pyruvate, water dikinase regulatory protein [Bacterioplanes sanyensis]ASP39893.1 phosphoenolpyruvate synthase regulatory protein [Bacterioplanes sanyensis]